MRLPVIAILLGLPLLLPAQEEDRKPSPFPEKNREREAAARKAAAARPKRESRSNTTADRADSSANEPGVGKAAYFVAKGGHSVTASGSASNAGEMVAAHASYPLGSRAIVTNLANGKSVEVKIVDRISDPRRIISVSEAAARQLGFLDAGVANVKVEPVRGGNAPAKP